MLCIEIEFDGDLVHWAVTEYVQGVRHVLDSGREAVVSDAMFRASECVEKFAPEELL
jgi:hypothetical protein